jgi:spore germination protein YaaH
MIGDGMATRNGARFLAPIALLATVAAIYLLAHRELAPKHVTVHTAPAHLAPAHRAKQPATTPRATQFYVVKSGDSFSTISAKTGISVQTLESLNVGVNPNTLQTGQRLRIRK